MDKQLDAIYSLLAARFNSGESDVAARHNEHQPHDLHAEIAAFAAEYGGTPLDLDKDLERAAVEALLLLEKHPLHRPVQPHRRDHAGDRDHHSLAVPALFSERQPDEQEGDGDHRQLASLDAEVEAEE